ncbi:MAG: hypothetical protein ABJH45_15460 [Paracoccaceae bacterium]
MKQLLKCAACLAIALAALPATAAPCPDDFDFVDFGITDANFQISHGGLILDLTHEDGQILDDAAQDCIPYVGQQGPLVDSAGKPVPLVGTLTLNGRLASENISMLKISQTMDVTAAQSIAQGSSLVYETHLRDRAFVVTRGEDFICVSIKGVFNGALSCEIPSLSQENAPAVVHCSAVSCVAPVLFTDTFVVTVLWESYGEGIASPSARGTWVSGIVTSALDLVQSAVVESVD